MIYFKRTILLNFFSLLFIFSVSIAEIVKEVKILGNKRISNETILVFSNIKTGDNLNENDLNLVIKNLYETNFFENVSVKLIDSIFTIEVVEAPLIQNINITGIKAKKNVDLIMNNLILKEKSSFNEILLSQELELIKSNFRLQGFYFTKVEALIEKLENNLVNIEYKINLGDKSKISKLSFIGDKIYKKKKLQSIIVSEEYRFWKFISGKKYLQEELINLDKRLLTNFYLNNGYYNIKINSSFAKLINKDEFELIFNIESGKKIFFGDLNLVLPSDFDKENFSNLNDLLQSLKNIPYSIYSVEKILDEINIITTQEEFKNVKAYTEETVNDDKLNINFVIEESEKFFVEKINIYGNNVTRENVIRNQLEIDEGDPFSELLSKKSENNIKSLNFFKSVKTTIENGSDENSKIINIDIQEKATGEIMAGAGTGTDGGTVTFGVKENNYLGKGIGLDANASISSEVFRGRFDVINPNYNNSDKLVFVSLQSTETDKLKDFGYKTNKNGFSLGTRFEYLNDFNLGLSTRNFFEKIETDSTASARQKKQKGNYFDSFVKLDFDLDKRNQKFRTTDGYFSNYSLSLPVISDTNTITNTYDYKIFTELFENNISSLSFSLGSVASLTDDDIKLSERLFLSSKKLRGFEKGKVGPKDGNDFVGGNYSSSLNLQSNIPMIFENSENLDMIVFLDAANVWGVDYDSSLKDGSKIRSSIGLGVDWITLVGPLSFSLSQVISKEDTDVEENFRFNLGTTF